MTSPIVLRIAPKPDCLSNWHLAELACGDVEASPAVRAHLTQCTRCHDLLQEQQTAVAHASLETIPARLFPARLADPKSPTHAKTTRQRRRWPLASMGAGLALAAASALALLQLPAAAAPPSDLTQGGVALLATVLRSNAPVAQDTPMQHVPVLMAGDRLRLHVTGAVTGSRVQLDGRAGDQWERLFDDALPADRWLPVDLRVVAGRATWLRLKVCDANGARCEEHTFEL